MTIDAVQTSLSAVKSTLAELQENAQEIASASVGTSPEPDLSPTQQVAEPQEAQSQNLNTGQQNQEIPTNTVISALAENIELESFATAQAKTLSTALDVLGTTTRIGDNVSVRA